MAIESSNSLIPDDVQSRDVSLATTHLKYSFSKNTLRGRIHTFERDINDKLLSLSLILTIVSFLKDASILKVILRLFIFVISELFLRALKEANTPDSVFRNVRSFSLRYIAMASFVCLADTLASSKSKVDIHGDLLSFWQLRVIGERQPFGKLEILWYDTMIMGLWVLIIANLCNFESIIKTKSLTNMRQHLMRQMGIDFLASYDSCNDAEKLLLFEDGFQGSVVLEVHVKKIIQT